MTLKCKAWNLLCDTARLRGYEPRDVIVGAYTLARELTGTPWADCFTPEWEQVVRRLGGGE